jgi:exportin-2 (importin alpha re-exporter)
MLASPRNVQLQLSEALTIICSTDFPDKWQNLIPELVSKFQCGDQNVLNGVLQTASSIFKRYRNQYKSQELYRELKYVLDTFVGTSDGPKPFLDLFKQQVALLESNPNQVDSLKTLFENMYIILRIYFSLHSQELPEVFEDTMADWMAEFHKFLVYENSALESNTDEASILTKVKAAICENVNVYIEKNEEEFQNYLQTFATDIWGLLLKVGVQSNKDSLTTTAIRFLTTVAKSVHHKLFEDASTMKQICEGVVIPNLKMREDEEELFEMNFIEYIRRDMEGSDSDTRRRSACELVKSLTAKFPEQVTALCSQYINVLIQEYASNPQSNWKSKDCAMYLIMALTVRGKTAAAGATSTNQLVNIGQFFQEHVVPELQSNKDTLPVLKADCLKFVITFRSQLPKETCIALLPSITALLTAESNVVHSYAATCLERMLAIKDAGKARFQQQELLPFIQTMLTGVFHAMEQPESEENEYLAKCFMRIVSFFGPQIGALTVECMKQGCVKLERICRNPTNSNFNHYMFETVAALIKSSVEGSLDNLSQYEQYLFPVFQIVLVEDLEDFAPYIFQILSQLIEVYTPPLPEVYTQIFPPLLNPVMWERSGNVPALVRLLQAYLSKQTVTGEQLQGVLGVFQKLIASKAHDHQGFFILNALVESLPGEALNPFLGNIWSLLCQRLQTSATPKYTKYFLIFLAVFIDKHGVSVVMNSIDSLQQGLFGMLLQQVLVPNFSSVTGDVESKLCSVALTKILCDCPTILSDQATWSKLLGILVSYIEGVTANSQEGDDGFDGEGMAGYSAAYAQLHHAQKKEKDPLPDISDVRHYLAMSLSKLSTTHPLAGVISQNLSSEYQGALQSYLSAANATLN